MWCWEIISGTMYDLSLAGAFTAAKGYSGFDFHKNNPASCVVHHLGPIPPGTYKIGTAYTHIRLGPVVMNLIPIAGDMFGRSEFRIHGDNETPDPWDGSHGCIILPRDKRIMISESTDRVLQVVAILPQRST